MEDLPSFVGVTAPKFNGFHDDIFLATVETAVVQLMQYSRLSRHKKDMQARIISIYTQILFHRSVLVVHPRDAEFILSL